MRVASAGSDEDCASRRNIISASFAKLSGKPEERIISYLMLRSLKQARYAADPLGHFALGFDEYTHFTSPIRRYPDLIVHRTLKWALAHPNETAPARIRSPRQNPKPSSIRYTQLEEIAAESSEAERRAAGAERELIDWKTAQFMEQHLGEEYEGLIISVQKFGCFVELFEVFVEGLVPINAHRRIHGCPRDLSRKRSRDRRHVRARRQTTAAPAKAAGSNAAVPANSQPGQQIWQHGDAVRVRAERIDPIRRRVEFALANSSHAD